MCIKNRLRSVMETKGLSIKEFADLCEMPYRTMQNYLLSDREPNAKALSSISTHLGVSLDWLVTGHGSMFRAESASNENMTPRQRAVLDMFESLTEDQQREILRDVEEKKRLAELEARVRELEQKKNLG